MFKSKNNPLESLDAIDYETAYRKVVSFLMVREDGTFIVDRNDYDIFKYSNSYIEKCLKTVFGAETVLNGQEVAIPATKKNWALFASFADVKAQTHYEEIANALDIATVNFGDGGRALGFRIKDKATDKDIDMAFDYLRQKGIAVSPYSHAFIYKEKKAYITTIREVLKMQIAQDSRAYKENIAELAFMEGSAFNDDTFITEGVWPDIIDRVAIRYYALGAGDLPARQRGKIPATTPAQKKALRLVHNYALKQMLAKKVIAFNGKQPVFSLSAAYGFKEGQKNDDYKLFGIFSKPQRIDCIDYKGNMVVGVVFDKVSVVHNNDFNSVIAELKTEFEDKKLEYQKTKAQAEAKTSRLALVAEIFSRHRE